jgi:DNA-directed RNA polymerase I and III subunit RPAC1
VYSSAFEWQAKGVQVQTFEDNPPRPVDDDILLAKMRPGQVGHRSAGLCKKLAHSV